MKKRSLVAALAMLIVSAMVLTSATYAWFYQTTSNVQVAALTASVTSSDGSIELKAGTSNAGTTAASNWVSSLAATDYIYATKQELHPVSIDFSSYDSTEGHGYYTSMGSAFKANYGNSTFTAGDQPHFGEPKPTGQSGNYAIDYMKYSFHVRVSTSDSVNGKNVTMTPDFVRGASCVYAAVKINNRIYVWSGTSDNYEPVNAISSAITDSSSGTVAIIDSADDGYTSGNMGAAVNGYGASAIKVFDTDVTASQANTLQYFTQEVEVYIWCEGNDANCIPGTTSDGTSLSFTFA